MEITSGVSIAQALGELKSMGFEMVLNEPIKFITQDGYDLHGETYCVIMHNKVTGALFYANAAKVNDICYGGAAIYLITKTWSDTWVLNHQFNYVQNSKEQYGYELFGHEITHHDGKMLQTYRQVVDTSELEPDTTKLGYWTMERIKIPQLREFDGIKWKASWYKWKHPELRQLFHGTSGCDPYSVNKALACLDMNQTISKIPDKLRWLYEPFLKDRYRGTLDVVYFTNNVFSSCLSMGISFRMAGTVETEIDKYYTAAKQLIKSYDVWDESYREDQINDLIRGKEAFYGRSEMIDKFFDEFGIIANSGTKASSSSVSGLTGMNLF